ncbi:MAG: UDP-N-acetylmuramate--L-alanine ligase, partial [Candidatus Omnitrophota bacterium]|nr:UDP-N-acetylmuramate--L-alanine ligase [Candidatus Omnitrophota bacterium]
LDEFAGSFNQTDYLIITDIYAAGEQPIDGVNAQALLKKIKEHSANKEVVYLPKEEIVQHIKKIISCGDLVITLGAGDILKVSDALAEELK